ncbi:hypothetical protein BGX26_008611 [Mortierella sp. AD094]|nr:hypothetical protein BGX26_008611 [Mortierella sp. AD094]
MIPRNNYHQGAVTSTGADTNTFKDHFHTLTPTAHPQGQTQAHVSYTSSLGKPGPIRTSNLNQSRQQQQLLSRPTHPPQQDQPRQRPLSMSRNHSVDGYTPDDSRILSSSSILRHQRIKSAGTRHMDEEHDRLQSLFRKARSQSLIHQHQGQQSQARPPKVEKRVSASPTEYGSSLGLYSSAQAGTRISTESTLGGLNVGAGESPTSYNARREFLQYLRAKAEQTRLKLQAIEQLERDIHGQQDGDSDSIDEDLDELISPYLPGSLSSPSDNQLYDKQSTASHSSSSLPPQQTTRKHSGTIRPVSGQRPQPGTIRHRYSADQLPPPPQQQQQRRQQRSSKYGQTSQQLYKRDQTAAQSTILRQPSAEFAMAGDVASKSNHPKQQNVHSTAATKSNKSSEVKNRRQPYGVPSRVFSSTSPCSSLSPPISPFSPIIGDGLQEPSTIHQSFSSAASRIHAQSKQHQGWRPESGSEDLSDEHKEYRYENDGSEDSLLHEHFGEHQEDLRDVTLSDMMNRHLVMLSGSDDYDTDIQGSDKATSSELQMEPESGNNDLHQADMTFADRTFQFMSKLERDFDSEAQSIPSLLSETIPENDFGDMTFITYVDPAETTDTINNSGATVTSGNRVQNNQQDRRQQSLHLPFIPVQKESILNEFLKSLPPLPQSPDSKQPPSNVQHSVTTAITSPGPISPLSGGNGRIVPLPTPIITSRERCQQIMLERSNSSSDRKREVQRHHRESSLRHSRSSAAILGETSSPLTSASPLVSTPWSNITTPLTSRGASCRDLPSAASTPISVYNSAKDEFTHARRFSVDNLREFGSRARSTNILPESLSRKPSRTMTTSSPNSAKMSSPMPLPPRHQPLDMIIVRPAKAAQAGGESSPWSPLMSTASVASDNSASSSWSWSWPSSILQSRANSSVMSLNEQLPQGKNVRTRIPSNSQPAAGIDIKSRSTSSLIKHQNGWLGFQVLDVKLVASGKYHIVVVTRSNQVYSCWETNSDNEGNNLLNEASDQEIEETLGRSTKTQVNMSFVQDTTCQPGLVRIQDGVSDVWPSNIIKIVCSDSATFLLTESGDLWGWGFFEDASGKRIGLLNQKPTSRPIQICSKRIKDVACGRNHILILNFSGDVISWGANEHGQLGRPCSQATVAPSQGSSHDQQDNFDLSPYFIENLPPCIIGIGAGKLSSFAWDEERLYGWGDNTYGQLGRDSTPGAAIRLKQSQIMSAMALYGSERRDTVSLPREIPLHWKGRSLKQIQGGERHTVILTLSGLVIAMGNDDFGQLGITSSAPTSSVASPVTVTSPSTPTSTSSSSSLTSQSSNESSSWFNLDSSSHNTRNVFERNPPESSVSVIKPKTRLFPALVRIGPGVKEIKCGDFHTVTCNDSGQMFTWGRGYDGVLAIHSLRSSQDQFILPSGRSIGGCMELTNTTKAVMSTTSLVERTRRVAAVSTMRAGISIALVSSD